MRGGRGATGIIAVLFLASAASGQGNETETYECDHVIVHYTGVDKAYAQSMARTAREARRACIDRYGFDMPETIDITIKKDPDQDEPARLSTDPDGNGTIALTVQSEKYLGRPSESGYHHVYGVCHELGHNAMYRLIRNYSWVKNDVLQSWANYIGRRLVDDVYAKEGPDLWPDKYDYYREEGTLRLNRVVAGEVRADGIGPNALWAQLGDIVGDKGFAPIFKAWDSAQLAYADRHKVRADDPVDRLRPALLAANPDKRLADWWDRAEPLIVISPRKSTFVPRPALGDFSAAPRELFHDNGVQESVASMAGAGHAVIFDVEGDTWYLTGVRVHGSRYGGEEAPKKDFRVWLCDANFRPIANFAFPYSSFEADKFDWVTFRVPPTNVPQRFIICVSFDPSLEEGVLVSHDDVLGEHSLTGLPGTDPYPSGANWMIRAVLTEAVQPDAPDKAKPVLTPAGAPADSTAAVLTTAP